MDTQALPWVSSLIRKSADYQIFAPPRSLSQLVTSFVGSQCQGIRPVLFFTWPKVLPDLAFKSGLSLLLFVNLTLSESSFFSLVFSVNLRNCILISQNPRLSWKTLVFRFRGIRCFLPCGNAVRLRKASVFISISFSLLTCLYTKYIFSFQGTLYFFQSTSGGPGWTRTTGLTLIRRAL